MRFLQDELGKYRKMCWPWHDPYRVLSRDDTNVSVTKVPKKVLCLFTCPGSNHAHRPPGFYFGNKQYTNTNSYTCWVDRLLADDIIPSEAPWYQL